MDDSGKGGASRELQRVDEPARGGGEKVGCGHRRGVQGRASTVPVQRCGGTGDGHAGETPLRVPSADPNAIGKSFWRFGKEHPMQLQQQRSDKECEILVRD